MSDKIVVPEGDEKCKVNSLWSTESSEYGCFYKRAGVELPLPGRRLGGQHAKSRPTPVDDHEGKTNSEPLEAAPRPLSLEELARELVDARKDIDEIKGILAHLPPAAPQVVTDGHDALDNATTQRPADDSRPRPPRPKGPAAKPRRSPSAPPVVPHGERVLVELTGSTYPEASRRHRAASVTVNDKELAPADGRYSYYKYYGYGGRGARTSWAHNYPLGAPPLPLPASEDPHLDAKSKPEVREFTGPATLASINHAKQATGFGPLGGSTKGCKRKSSVLRRILLERPERMAASTGALDKFAGKGSAWGPLATPRTGTTT
eukprot:jgi/Mesvir1/14329/Mv09740-RA.1